MPIVYVHTKKGTDEVFYVGIGGLPERAYSKSKRTDIWKKVVKKYGYDIKIIHNDISWEEACAIEKYLIAFYGRLGDGGCLVNFTEGGGGTYGRVCAASTKNILSEKAKQRFSDKENHPMFGKKHTEKSIEKNRNSQLGEKAFMFGRKGSSHPMFGYKYSEEEKMKMRLRTGVKNPNYGNRGGKNPISKKVISFKNGEYSEYDSIVEASLDTGCDSQSISMCCRKKIYQTKGFRFKYADDNSFIGEFFIKKRVLSEETKNKIRFSLLGKKRGKYDSSHKSIAAIC